MLPAQDRATEDELAEAGDLLAHALCATGVPSVWTRKPSVRGNHTSASAHESFISLQGSISTVVVRSSMDAELGSPGQSVVATVIRNVTYTKIVCELGRRTGVFKLP